MKKKKRRIFQNPGARSRGVLYTLSRGVIPDVNRKQKASSIRKGTIYCAPTHESCFFNAIRDTNYCSLTTNQSVLTGIKI